MSKYRKWIFCLTVLFWGCGLAMAGSAETASKPSSDVAKVTTVIQKKFPDAKFSDLMKVPDTQLYRMTVNGQYAYTDAAVDFVLVGELLLPKNGKVVDVTQASLDTKHSKLFNDLPWNQAIKRTFGNGQDKLAIFEDPNCPFCQHLESEMEHNANLNATVYVFLYPLDSLHPTASAHAQYLLCSKDPAKAWSSWMEFAYERQRSETTDQAWPQWLSATNRPASLTCKSGAETVAANLKLGRSFGFNATPTLLFPGGYTFVGYLPQDKLAQAFQIVAAKAVK